jgi:hypothetical protein
MAYERINLERGLEKAGFLLHAMLHSLNGLIPDGIITFTNILKPTFTFKR